jgi:hypothetical protein
MSIRHTQASSRVVYRAVSGDPSVAKATATSQRRGQLGPTIRCMSDAADHVDHPDVFVAAMTAGTLTDAEIAEWIRVNRPAGPKRTEVTNVISQFKGGPITGPIRTALRSLDGLPPVPEDEGQ